MKRSEMLEKLAAPLSWLGGGMYTSSENLKNADSILSIIEKAGMLPPIEQGRVEQDLDLGLPQWEPEDDNDCKYCGAV